MRFMLSMFLFCFVGACGRHVPDLSSSALLSRTKQQCFAGESFSLALPRVNEGSNLRRDSVLYALEPLAFGLKPGMKSVTVTVCSVVDKSLTKGLAGLVGKSDLKVFRWVLKNILHSGKLNAYRNLKREGFLVPETLDDLLKKLKLGSKGQTFAQLNIAKEAMYIKQPSQIKARARVLVDASQPGQEMKIAFNLGSKNVEKESIIVETELAVARTFGRARDWDYFTYDEHGKLSRCAHFFTGQKMLRNHSPYACMSCHYSAKKRRFRGVPAKRTLQRVEDWSNIDPNQLPVTDKCPASEALSQ